LISGGLLSRFLGVDSVPAPDGPVVRAAVFLAFEVEARDGAEDVEPGAGVSSDFDLSLDRSERVEGLIKEVAHHTGLRLIAGGADVADAEVVVHAHVALDEAGDLPFMSLSIVAFEDQDVASAGGSGIALAAALVIGMGKGAADGVAEVSCIAGLSGANAVGETSLFHGGFLTAQRSGPQLAVTSCRSSRVTSAAGLYG